MAAGGYTQLQFHQIDAGDFLRDAVLDLQARIDFEEPQVPARGQQELAGRDPDVIDGLEQTPGGLDEPIVNALGQVGGGGLFEKLLVAALQTAIPGGHDGERAVPVAGALGLHVPCGSDELLENQRAAAGSGGLEGWRGADVLVRSQHGDAPAPAAVGPFEGHGVAVGVRE